MTGDQKIAVISFWGTMSGLLIAACQVLGVAFTVPVLAALIVLPGLGLLLFWYLGSRTALFDRIYRTVLFNRIYLTLQGASKKDFFIDLFRILALFGLGLIVLWRNGLNVFRTWSGIAYVVLLLIVYFHAFVYPFVRKPGKWDENYKMRKTLVAAAIVEAAVAVSQGRISPSMRNIEAKALAAIKSYLEYSVLDRDGTNFNVNLIVRHPDDPARLVCIRRTNVLGDVPTHYKPEEVPTLTRSFETGEPLYIGDFRSARKPYKMMWHLPIMDPSGDANQVIGLVGIDSRISRHLDFVDDRESLHFNLLPFIALLRFSLVIRSTNRDFWNDVL